MKRILVIYYSQSGQLYEIVNNIVENLRVETVQVDFHKIQPVEDYPFPWKKTDFFDVFPESFQQKTIPLEKIPTSIKNTDYDLIILGYQVWYLSPSVPINSFLQSEEGKNILQNKPVVSVIACRNMWIMAQEKVKCLLAKTQAKLVGNIALVDRHINHISVITIVHWMFTGKKTRYLTVFPKPGVSATDIQSSKRFGNPIYKALQKNDYTHLQQELVTLKSVNIHPFLILADKRANILFGKWANFIAKKGSPKSKERKLSLKLFNYYLIIAIWVFMPIVFILFLLTYPFFYAKIKKQKAYYRSVSLKTIS